MTGTTARTREPARAGAVDARVPSSLAGFRNRHAGETIVVCGCGASLLDLPNPEGLITIGVNDVGRLFDPTYLVVVNNRHQFNGDRFRYVESSRATAVFSHLDLGIQHPHQVRIRLGRYGGTDLSDPHRLHYTRNSPYVALCLAVHMGARRIGLIGVDFTDHHFFAATGPHALTRELAKIDREYGSLARACEQRGLELVNLSAQSRLSALPREAPEVFLRSEVPERDRAADLPERAWDRHRRVFFVHYRFQNCGEVFTQGLHHGAAELGLTYEGAYWDDPDLQRRIREFRPDLVFVVHGRRFAQRSGRWCRDLESAVWLLDEPYEVDDTARWSGSFRTQFVNDPATLGRHPNAHYLPAAFDPAVHRPGTGERSHLVGFIGDYSPRRERMLCALAEAGLLSYAVGGPWRSGTLKGLCLADRVPSDRAASLYRQTQLVLNVYRERHHFNRRGLAAGSLNPRVYEALASGALVISEPRPETHALFPDLPLFQDDRSLVELVRALLGERQRREHLVEACRARLAGHSYAERLRTVLAVTSAKGSASAGAGAVAKPVTSRTGPVPRQVPAPPGSGDPGPQVPFTAVPVRNLIYHLWPVKGETWRWNLDQLLARVDLFNGRRILAIVRDEHTVEPGEVLEHLEGHGFEIIVEENRPNGECVTFPRLLREVASRDPNEISFYAHGKGVRYEPKVPAPVIRWAEAQYRTCLDDWIGVRDHLQRYALTGPIKRMGRYFTHKRLGKWHYCGTFFWLRHARVFDRDCLDPPDFYGGVEAWPGIHFQDQETGCLLVRLQQRSSHPYQEGFWRSLGDRSLRTWENGLASVPVPPDLARPQGVDGHVLPRTEQKPEELEWWMRALLERDVRSLLVIGSAEGGVEWHLARVFREQGRELSITSLELSPIPGLQGTLGEIRDRFRQSAQLVEGCSASPDVRDRLDPHYDAVFIDGDHGYRAVRGDWNLAKSLGARVVGFHDIVDSHWHAQNRCCVSRLWREIRGARRTLEKADGDWGGIGLAEI